MKDLRPVGLCNNIYKIILKILTLRLCSFMDNIINMEQSVFTRNYFIADNILINHEVMHSLKLRRKYKNYGIAVKLNISKAYECVEWDYLNHMLVCFSFSDIWIKWIMSYVTIVS